jgi:hypothetical protein
MHWQFFNLSMSTCRCIDTFLICQCRRVNALTFFKFVNVNMSMKCQFFNLSMSMCQCIDRFFFNLSICQCQRVDAVAVFFNLSLSMCWCIDCFFNVWLIIMRSDFLRGIYSRDYLFRLLQLSPVLLLLKFYLSLKSPLNTVWYSLVRVCRTFNLRVLVSSFNFVLIYPWVVLNTWLSKYELTCQCLQSSIE